MNRLFKEWRPVRAMLVAAGWGLMAGAVAGEPTDHDRRMEWFREARFGMFIHFGLYSTAAGEWDGKPVGFVEYFGFRNPADWQTLLPKFNPEKFDADAIVLAAKEAGMKYLVITSKHHDGFCLFDSKHTDFDVMSTPFKRDIIGELSAACRKHGLKFGFYYSIIDLHHPDYLPRPAFDPRPEEGRDFDRYVRFMKDQLKELLTNYGEIDVVWFDGEWESSWTHERAKDMWDYIRGLDPDVLINNRIDKGREGMKGLNTAPHFLGDFGTPEQELVDRNPGEDWETCQTMNRKGNWGWRKDEADFYSQTELVRQVVSCVSMGGNMLLNVGPKDDGTIPETSRERLKVIGKWMAVHGGSIHGATASPYEEPPAWGTATVKGDVMYGHVFDRPADGALVFPPLAGPPTEAWALADPAKSPLKVEALDDGRVRIDISQVAADRHATVIALRFPQAPAAAAGASGAAIDDSFPLVSDETALCTIVTAVTPTPSARLAALELQTHFLKMTGVEIPIQTEADASDGARILVGDTAATRALGIRQEDFEDQEYLIAFRGRDLILSGRDWLDTAENRVTSEGRSVAEFRLRIDYWHTVGFPDRGSLEIELPGLYDPHGSSHAAYHFLDDHCGVRWYGPTELTSVVPKVEKLTVERKDVRRAPALKHRAAMSAGMWPFMRGQWGGFTQSRPLLELFWRRLRLGGEPWEANHTITQRSIPAAMNDPAIQAHGQARSFNLCYTNPATVALIAGMARDYFDGKGSLPPDARARGDYFAVVPEDVWYFCDCPDCKKLLDEGSDAGAGLFASAAASEYWFSFVNAVAREVRKTHPEKWIATLAYWNYSHPPKTFAMEPNVSVAPCLHVCEYPMNRAVLENDRTLYQAWQAASDAPMFLWNYYHLPTERALIQGWKCFPHIMLRQTAGVAKRFANDGVRGIFICGEQDQLEHYVMVRLWDDPTLDVEAMVDEFFQLYFGPAGGPMKRFYNAIESVVCDASNYPDGKTMQDAEIAWSHLGTPERMKSLGAMIAAAGSAADDEVTRQRVGLWKQAIWQWMLDGRAAYEASQQ